MITGWLLSITSGLPAHDRFEIPDSGTKLLDLEEQLAGGAGLGNDLHARPDQGPHNAFTDDCGVVCNCHTHARCLQTSAAKRLAIDLKASEIASRRSYSPRSPVPRAVRALIRCRTGIRWIATAPRGRLRGTPPPPGSPLGSG